MVRGNIFLPKPLGQRTAEPLYHAPRIHKDERRPVFPAQRRHAVAYLNPHLGIAHRPQFRRRYLDLEVQRPPPPHLNNGGWAQSIRLIVENLRIYY